MAKRGRKPLNSIVTPTPAVPESPPSDLVHRTPAPKPPEPTFKPVTMHYRGIEKVVTTKAQLDAELARGKWKVKT